VLIALGTAVLGVLAAVAVFVLVLEPQWCRREVEGWPRRPFSTDAWRAQESDRKEFVHDLIASRRLDGLGRADALALLGDPDRTDDDDGEDLVYWLGPADCHFSADDWLFRVAIDAGGRVSRYGIESDLGDD